MSSSIVKLRFKAFQNQAGHCYYCGSPMWLKDKEGFAIQHAISLPMAAEFKCTAEHLQARCDGGNNSKSNIVAACIFCNTKRHHRKNALAPIGYRKHVQKRLDKGKWHSIVAQSV